MCFLLSFFELLLLLLQYSVLPPELLLLWQEKMNDVTLYTHVCIQPMYWRVNKRRYLIFSDQFVSVTQLMFELCLQIKRTHEVYIALTYTCIQASQASQKMLSCQMEIITCLTFSPSSWSLAMLHLSSSCFSCSTASSCTARRCCRAS